MIRLPFKDLDMVQTYVSTEDYSSVWSTLLHRQTVHDMLSETNHKPKTFGLESLNDGLHQNYDNITDKRLDSEQIIREVIIGANQAQIIISGYNNIFESDEFLNQCLPVLLDMTKSDLGNIDTINQEKRISMKPLDVVKLIPDVENTTMAVVEFLNHIHNHILNLVIANKLYLAKLEGINVSDCVEDWGVDPDTLLNTHENDKLLNDLLKINGLVLGNLSIAIDAFREVSGDGDVEALDNVSLKLDELYAHHEIKVIEKRVAALERMIQGYPVYSMENIVKNAWKVFLKMLREIYDFLKKVIMDIKRYVTLLWRTCQNDDKRLKGIAEKIRKQIGIDDFKIFYLKGTQFGVVTQSINNAASGIIKVDVKDKFIQYFKIDDDFTKIVSINDDIEIRQIEDYEKSITPVYIPINHVTEDFSRIIKDNMMFKLPVIHDFTRDKDYISLLDGNLDVVALYELYKRGRDSNNDYAYFQAKDLSRFRDRVKQFLSINNVRGIGLNVDSLLTVTGNVEDDVGRIITLIQDELKPNMLQLKNIQNPTSGYMSDADSEKAYKYCSQFKTDEFIKVYDRVTKRTHALYDELNEERSQVLSKGFGSNPESLKGLTIVLSYIRLQLTLNQYLLSMMTNTNLMLGRVFGLTTKSSKLLIEVLEFSERKLNI